LSLFFFAGDISSLLVIILTWAADCNMAPTESAILNKFLLTPSQLPAIITPQEFTALFPRPQQSSTQVRTLYRDLQTQRNGVVDVVAANIENEAKRSKGLRRAVVRARREAETQEYDQEIEIERSVCTGSVSGRGHMRASQLRVCSYSATHPALMGRNALSSQSSPNWKALSTTLRPRSSAWRRKRQSYGSRSVR
jgi:hypothetical protein